MSSEKMLRILGLEKRRIRDDLIAFYSLLNRRNGEEGTNLFSLVTNSRICENRTKFHCGGLGWMLGKISLPQGWSNNGIGFLAK